VRTPPLNRSADERDHSKTIRFCHSQGGRNFGGRGGNEAIELENGHRQLLLSLIAQKRTLHLEETSQAFPYLSFAIRKSARFLAK
jgi:hypothetical protein